MNDLTKHITKKKEDTKVKQVTRAGATLLAGWLASGVVGGLSRRYKLPMSKPFGEGTGKGNAYSSLGKLITMYGAKKNFEKRAEVQYGQSLPETSRIREYALGTPMAATGGYLANRLTKGLSGKVKALSTIAGTLFGAGSGSYLGRKTYSNDEKAYLAGARTKASPNQMASEAANLQARKEMSALQEDAQYRIQKGSQKITNRSINNRLNKGKYLRGIYGGS